MSVSLVGTGYGARWAVAAWVRPARPVIEFTEAVDLGVRELGEIVTREVTIRNSGTADLVIDQVRSNCSCSGLERRTGGGVESVSDLVLRPGESEALVARVAVRGVPGQSINAAAAGRLTGEVYVEITRDSGPTRAVIPVAGTVADALSVSPAALILPRHSDSGPVYSATCLCRGFAGRPLSLTVADTPAGISVTIDESPAGTKVVRLTWDPNVAPEPGVRQVRLIGDVDGATSSISIAVDCRKTGGR
ncbi:MAG: DUF1573 domain-containing protein [Gemmataceae bacterium]